MVKKTNIINNKNTTKETTQVNLKNQSVKKCHADKKKVSTKDIIKMIAQYASENDNRKMRQYEVKSFLDYLATCITSSLQCHQSVFLPKIGTFTIQENKETNRRNPQNGQLMKIPGRKSIKCKCFKSFTQKALNTNSQ